MPSLSHGTHLVWRLAASETMRTMHVYLEQEFALIGLCRLGKWLRERERDEDAPQRQETLQAVLAEAESVEAVLHRCGINPAHLCEGIRTSVGKGMVKRVGDVIHRSPACRMTFQRADQLALKHDAEAVHCLHLLSAILEQPGTLITRVVTDLGVNIAILYAEVQAALVSIKEQSVALRSTPLQEHGRPLPAVSVYSATPTPYLDKYGSDLTQRAREGGLDPIVGRKGELLELVRVLHQKTKNMAILISEPGVSRIAVIKGFALRIANGNIVPSLRHKRLVEIPVYDLARPPFTHSQGQRTLQQMIEEASRHPDVILFIDGIHTLLGSGQPASPLDLTTLLKPALDRGTVHCIGATTTEQYQQYMASDPFCARYCQPVVVNEPNTDEMQAILEQVRPRYEEHHMVTITTEALETVVALTAKYMPDKRFPEKALDVLDQACARARISQITILEMDVQDLEDTAYEVTQDTIAAVVAQKTGIKVGHLLESPRDRLRRLAHDLAQLG